MNSHASAKEGSEERKLLAFFRAEATGGGLLVVAAAVGVIFANSGLSGWYENLRHLSIGVDLPWGGLKLDAAHWAADGLLAVFFFLVGLELKREFLDGQLRNMSTAFLPVLGAVGGVVVPALIFLLFNLHNPEGLRGWAIPTATDIAFALAVLAVAARGLPSAIRIFLLTLAVVDDVIAISIIAFFYSKELSLLNLFYAVIPLVVFAFLLHRFRVFFFRHAFIGFVVLFPLAAAVWYFIFVSGVHATIAGVLVGFAVPIIAKSSEKKKEHSSDICIAEKIEHNVLLFSSLVCVPIFAFFSAGARIHFDAHLLLNPVFLGVFLGLVFGKPIGITLFVWTAIKVFGLRPPRGLALVDVFIVSIIAGIGFTVCLLVIDLSFGAETALGETATLAVFAASLLSAVVGGLLIAARARNLRQETG